MATRIFRPARVRSIGAVVVLVAVLLLVIAWLERRRIASDLIDRRLAAAGVTGSYRIVGLGPVHQVIEDVRLGDPARPDLVAARVDLRWRYRLGVPVLASVRASGVRVAARWRDGRVSLGSLDRLLPRSTTGASGLPDLRLDLSDVIITLLTPAGTVRARLDGTGNPTRDFAGMIRVQAPGVAVGKCAIDRVAATMRIETDTAGARLVGPLMTGQTACPTFRLQPGRAALDVRVAPTLDRAEGKLSLGGFGGAARLGRYQAASGAIDFTATQTAVDGRSDIQIAGLAAPQIHAETGRLVGRYHLGKTGYAFDGDVAVLDAVAAPAIAETVANVSRSASATPIGPIAARIGGRLTQLLRRSSLHATLTLRSGAETTVRITQARLVSTQGANLILAGTLDRARGGWAMQGRLSGTDLPTLAILANRPAPGQAIQATITPSAYRAGAAALAFAPVRVRVDNSSVRIVTRATLSGPIGLGTIEGLMVPIALTVRPDGGASLDGGCVDASVRQVRFASAALDPASARLCGGPVLAVSRRGAVSLDAHLATLALTGHSGNAPLAIDSGPIKISMSGFTAERVQARLGAGPDPTRLAIGTLAGRFHTPAAGGRFAGAEGSITNVPLALSGAAGSWSVEHGALRLNGALAIADRATSARFARLAARDVALSLADGRISATGTLVPADRSEHVATVTLRHDLSQGRGWADITVPELTFARKGLQPEMLTPLTLGVVANVAGTVRGHGRIDWSPAGTTSSGAFNTDRIDLAAAFGPVTGLSGAITFTDLLGLVSAPHQQVRAAVINPGIAVTDGIVRYHLPGADRVAVEDGRWPFAGGTLTLEPALLDFAAASERRLTFRVDGLDAAAFVQQLDFPNISASGTFDGRLPMVFGQAGGRIERGGLRSRGGGTLAYVGPLSNAQLGTMGKLAFDALKAIRYSRLDLALEGNLDGEIVTRVGFDGVRQGTDSHGLIARAIRNLPFRFNIAIRAPFRALVGTAASYANPALLLQQLPPAAVQPPDSAGVR